MIFIKDFDINTYDPFKKTAIKRNSLSTPMKILYNKGLLNGRCLDYATGYGLDVKYLKELGIYIKGYDKFNPEFNNKNLLDNTYNCVVSIYMFNTIPDLNICKEELNKIKKIGENIYISVRSDTKVIRDNWRYIKSYDGYITTNNSFQRFYNEESVSKYFGEVDYIHNAKDFKLFKLHI